MLFEEIIDFFEKAVFSDAAMIESCGKRPKAKRASSSTSPSSPSITPSVDIFSSEIVPQSEFLFYSGEPDQDGALADSPLLRRAKEESKAREDDDDLNKIERNVYFESTRIVQKNREQYWQKKFGDGDAKSVDLLKYRKLKGKPENAPQQVGILNEYRDRFLNTNSKRDIIKIMRENKLQYHGNSSTKRFKLALP